VLDNRDFLILDLFDTDVHKKLLGTGVIWYTSLMNDTVFRKLHPWLCRISACWAKLLKLGSKVIVCRCSPSY